MSDEHEHDPITRPDGSRICRTQGCILPRPGRPVTPRMAIERHEYNEQRRGRPVTLPGRVRLEIQLSARHDAALRAMAADWGLPRAAAVRRLIEARKQWREAGA